MTRNKGIVFSLDSMCSFSFVTLVDGYTSFVQVIGFANVTSYISLSFIILF